MNFTAPSPHSGMGAVPVEDGVTFRVWAPHATQLWVIGDFNGWDSGNNPVLARDDDGNGVRDVMIDDLAPRFDHTQNGAVASDQRWGLDNDLNNLRVERHDYATFDQAAIFTVMTDTLACRSS